MVLKLISDEKNTLVCVDGKTLSGIKELSIECGNDDGQLSFNFDMSFDKDAIERERQRGADIKSTSDGFYYLEGLDFDFMAAQMEVTDQMEKERLCPLTSEDSASVFLSRMRSLLAKRSRWPRQPLTDE